jgi:hypothetical protein
MKNYDFKELTISSIALNGLIQDAIDAIKDKDIVSVKRSIILIRFVRNNCVAYSEQQIEFNNCLQLLKDFELEIS